MFSLTATFKAGLRTLVLLGSQEGDSPLPISEMTSVIGMSDKSLEQLLMSLRRAGLVRSVRGANGGFLLGRDPSKISLKDIMTALQGPIRLCDCSNQPNCQECVRPEVWNALEMCFEGTLASLSLSHLISEQSFQILPHSVVLPDSPLWQEGSGI